MHKGAMVVVDGDVGGGRGIEKSDVDEGLWQAKFGEWAGKCWPTAGNFSRRSRNLTLLAGKQIGSRRIVC